MKEIILQEGKQTHPVIILQDYNVTGLKFLLNSFKNKLGKYVFQSKNRRKNKQLKHFSRLNLHTITVHNTVQAALMKALNS